MNCQIRGVASIRKGLGKEHTPFLVSSKSIIASENVSGRVSSESFGSLWKAIFTKPEGSQSGGVPILPIRKGPNFASPEGSQFCQSGRVPILPIRRGTVFANPEGYYSCQPGGVLFLPIRRGLVFANPEETCFCQSGGVLFFANPEGYCFCQSGGVLFC